MENTCAKETTLLEEREGFEGFYKRNFLKVKLSLVFMGVDDETAKDLAQEAFTRLWLSWANFEQDAARMKFLKVVSRNLWIDRYRKTQKEFDFIYDAEEDTSLQQTLDYKDLLEVTKAALCKFDETKRDIYYEIKLHGASYKDVSERFNINMKTLERYMTQMSKAVKTYLKKYYPHLSALFVLLNFFK